MDEKQKSRRRRLVVAAAAGALAGAMCAFLPERYQAPCRTIVQLLQSVL